MTVKYIIGHWTAGNHTPNKLDKNSYQLLIDAEGAVHRGVAQGCTASTGGMNSITYNIACCGGLSTSRLTPVQLEKELSEFEHLLEKKFVLKETHNIAISEMKSDIAEIKDKIDKIYDKLMQA